MRESVPLTPFMTLSSGIDTQKSSMGCIVRMPVRAAIDWQWQYGKSVSINARTDVADFDRKSSGSHAWQGLRDFAGHALPGFFSAE